MLRIPGMPLLPGTEFRPVHKSYYPKPQSLLHFRGIPILSDRLHASASVDPSGSAADIRSCPPASAQSIYPPQSGPHLPSWLAYYRKVLSFNAYFKQTLQETFHAPYIVRHVKIYYYLEDGTLDIHEKRIDNSGIVQGCLVHRQRVPKPPPCDNEFLSIVDLNVDKTVEIFDCHYHIVNCDNFTRHFLNKRGIAVPDPVEPPVDPGTAVRNRQPARANTLPAKRHPFAQFLKHDPHVLSFKAYWDDRSDLGDVRKLELCYYLADDTIEIREPLVRYSGRNGPTLFLKRCRLQREFDGLPLPGQNMPVTLLNVLHTSRSARYIVDPLNLGNKEIVYYNQRDFQIGAAINVYGRTVVITDMDPWTRQYYRDHYGIEQFTPLAPPTRSDAKEPYDKSVLTLPPYNGWGSYEDSAGNCMSIMNVQPPRTNFRQFVNFDKIVLRFGAKMLSTIRENCERIFIINYYLSDNTMQVQEVTVRNSGFLGGQFMHRDRVLLPGQEKFSCKKPQYYMPCNFYIGATMSIKDHIFHLVSADEYTLMYMEHHPDQFKHTNVEFILEKLRKAIPPQHVKDFISNCLPACQDLEQKLAQKSPIFVSYESLKGALIARLGNEISDHEIITICRHFSGEPAPSSACDRDKVLAAAHLEIKRALWNGRDDLMEHFHHINPMNKPFLPVAQVRSTLRGFRMPFTPELIDNMLLVLNRNECDEIEICDLMNFIDMSCFKGCDISPMNYAFELCPKIPIQNKGRVVDFSCFLKALNLSVQTQDNHAETNVQC